MDRPNLNVAFSAAGLTALGVSADRMTDFSREFREGMVTPHRQRILGDLRRLPERSAPVAVGRPANPPVHGVLLFFAADEAALDALRRRGARAG